MYQKEECLIDKDKLYTVIIGNSYKQLTKWLEENNIEYSISKHTYEPAIARNIAILDFLNSDKSTLLMFDGDQIPSKNTNILDFPEKQLVYCGYPSRNFKLKGHFGKGDFAAGCFRCTKEVIIAMKDELDIINKELHSNNFHFPQQLEVGWFGRATYNYGSAETTCSCNWFNALSTKVGYQAEMVGTIGHAVSENETIYLADEYSSYASGKFFKEINVT